MSEAFTYTGTCHCGAIRATLRLTKAPHEVQARACQCGFCSRHGAMTVSDPNGHALFDVDESHLAKYQFGTRSGTVLLCAACGTYAGVILEVDGRMWSVANVRGLAIPQFKGVVAHAVDYDGETVESRIARRKRMWTPTEMTLSA